MYIPASLGSLSQLQQSVQKEYHVPLSTPQWNEANKQAGQTEDLQHSPWSQSTNTPPLQAHLQSDLQIRANCSACVLCHIHGPSKDGRQTGMDTRRTRMVRSATTSVTCFLGQLPHDKCDGDFVSLFPATALIARTHLMLARSPSTSCHDGHGSIAVVVSLDVGLSIVPFPIALALPLQRGSICKIFFLKMAKI